MKWWEYLLGGIVVVFFVGLLIPTVPRISNEAHEIAASKFQYVGYVTAIQLFRGEYREYPQLFDEAGVFKLNQGNNTEKFIETISGRDLTGQTVGKFGNRRQIAFCSFSESELQEYPTTGRIQIVDRTGNSNIILCIDHDDDGLISVPDGDSTKQIRAFVTAYSLDENGQLAIRLWD